MEEQLKTTGARTQTGLETLPELFSRLGEQTMSLLEAKFNLLVVEVKEDLTSYIRGGVFLFIGALIVSIGFALLNIALALFVASLFTFADPRMNYALGFLLTGTLYLIIGGIVISAIKSRLAARNPLPERSLEELRKDKQWLTRESLQ